MVDEILCTHRFGAILYTLHPRSNTHLVPTGRTPIGYSGRNARTADLNRDRFEAASKRLREAWGRIKPASTVASPQVVTERGIRGWTPVRKSPKPFVAANRGASTR